jgi:predicted transcriptional regulator
MKLNEGSRYFDLTLTALAHPVRRAILERVMQTESRVTELAKPFAMSLNAVSKHIRILERAGLVSRRAGIGVDRKGARLLVRPA